MVFLGSKCSGDIGIFGVPFDGTTCFRPGTRFGPDGIRFFSENLETYSPVLDRDLENVDYVDLGNVEIPVDVQGMIAKVEDFVKSVGKTVLLGGEHSVSYPVIASLKKRYGSLTVVHFDAHADLRDDYSGSSFSHACVMRRVLDIGCDIIQLGIRSGTREEFNLIKREEKVELISSCLLPDALASRDYLYVSVDIDYFDPAFAPGTGTPEPCGGNPVEFFNILYNLPPVNVVGFDVVEVSPPYDSSGITQMLAAKIVREMILKFWGG